MSLKLAAGLSIVCGGSLPASAERAIDIELSGPAPFEASELAAAMRMRLPADGAAVRVRVTGTADGVHVDTTLAAATCRCVGSPGPAAARLVALAASDLLLSELAAAPGCGAGSPRKDRIEPLTRRCRVRWGCSGSAAGWEGVRSVLGAASLDLAQPVRGYLGIIEVEGGAIAGGDVALIAAVVRVDGGLRTSVFELRAGLTIAPIYVRTGAADLTALIGGNASVRIRIPVTRAARAVLALGADVFVTRTSYLLDGATVMTTPRAAPWVAAGMEVAL
ncbi:MAG: hypothetical protein IPQ07_41300 [Myxococcales bacterium]|nr:hypothetical protein [Myxococcales bacterium]